MALQEKKMFFRIQKVEARLHSSVFKSGEVSVWWNSRAVWV